MLVLTYICMYECLYVFGENTRERERERERERDWSNADATGAQTRLNQHRTSTKHDYPPRPITFAHIRIRLIRRPLQIRAENSEGT